MAPTASSKPIGLQISLVFFVLTTLILAVTTYMFHRSYSDGQASVIEATNKMQQIQKLATDADNKVTALKGHIGLKLDAVESNDPADATTVGGGVRAKISSAGPNAGTDLVTTIDKILQAHNVTDADRTQISSRLAAQNAEVLALQARYQAMADVHDAAKKKAEADLRDIARNRDELLAAKDREIAELRKMYNDSQAEIANITEQREKERKKAADEITRLEGINDKLRDELDVLKQQSFEVADGLIRRVENETRLVWVNLGSADYLRPRVTFSVYAKDNSGIGRGQDDIKGMIEITRIIDAHMAEGKITDEDILRPMAPGDQIYSPLWNPGRVEQFSMVGIIDIDNDGRSDREMMHQIIATAGAAIDNEVDDEGNRTGDGINERTKFLVLGDIPDIAKLARPEDQERVQKIIDHLKDLRKEARLNGVRIVNLNDFMAYLGVKPRRRLFQPGQERPYNLTAGAHSTAVNAPIMKGRESAGQVSGALSRKKYTPQPESSGQTSKAFMGPRGK